MTQPAQANTAHKGQSPAPQQPTAPFCLPAPSWVWWVLLLALLLPFAYAFGFLFPRGDDIDEVTRAMFPFDLPGGLYEIVREWLTWSGRYTYHFLAVFLGKAGDIRPLYGLVCAGVAARFGLGMFGLARVVQVKRWAAIFCGLLTVVVVLAGHQSLPNFYLLTDALTMGLLQSMTLIFLWALCRLWHAPAAQARRVRWHAVILGVLTVGVFEHSALAAFAACTVAVLLALVERFGARETEPDAAQNARTRLRHLCIVWLWVLGAVLFSFFAPGNQVRRAARHIDTAVQMRQLAAAFDEWQQVAFWIFDGLWPWAVLLLVLLLRGLRGQTPLRARATAVRNGLLLTGLAVAAYLGLSGLLTVLHALSDVTISSTSKLPAGLAVFAAYALGSLIAGLAFGAFRIAMPMAEQFFIGILVTAITAVLPIFSPGVYVLALLLFVSGVSFAPTMVIVMNLGTLILPPQRITEGLTWMSTGISIGVAFGGVLAGLVIDAHGARAGFAVPIVAGGVMVLIVLQGLRTLRAAAQTQSQREIGR